MRSIIFEAHTWEHAQFRIRYTFSLECGHAHSTIPASPLKPFQKANLLPGPGRKGALIPWWGQTETRTSTTFLLDSRCWLGRKHMGPPPEFGTCCGHPPPPTIEQKKKKTSVRSPANLRTKKSLRPFQMIFLLLFQKSTPQYLLARYARRQIALGNSANLRSLPLLHTLSLESFYTYCRNLLRNPAAFYEIPNPLPRDPNGYYPRSTHTQHRKTAAGTPEIYCLSLEIHSRTLSRTTLKHIARTWETQCNDPSHSLPVPLDR